MLLADVVATSTTVAATRSRKAKVSAIAALLGTTAPDEIEIVTSYLAGSLRQRRIGLGWRSVSSLPDPADTPVLSVLDVHAAFDQIASLAGAGSQAERAAAVADLFGRATATEQEWLRGAVTGAVRQGALGAIVQEAVAAAADVPVTAVRRAAMFAGSTVAVAVAALSGGEKALAAFGLEVGRPVSPMLASSAPDLAAAMAKAAGGSDPGPVAIDVKLDGIRIQVHRSGQEVLISTRSLDDITDRLPEVVTLALSLPASTFVLDGEALALGEGGRPRPFQETASRAAQSVGVNVRPEQVVEIAFDGVQRSSRYPGGVALRFARMVRYRDDKSADEADTIEMVREHLTG